MTGQSEQTALAWSSRLRRRGPRSPSGWKKTSGLTPRQAPSSCQSHRSATGPGRRGISAINLVFRSGGGGAACHPVGRPVSFGGALWRCCSGKGRETTLTGPSITVKERNLQDLFKKCPADGMLGGGVSVFDTPAGAGAALTWASLRQGVTGDATHLPATRGVRGQE